MLTYAGDDGRERGQTYRLALDLEAGVGQLRFRCPDETGIGRQRRMDTGIALPRRLQERLRTRDLPAPTLREERRAGGEPFAVFDFTVEVDTEAPPDGDGESLGPIGERIRF
jgi:hypothetical protein